MAKQQPKQKQAPKNTPTPPKYDKVVKSFPVQSAPGPMVAKKKSVDSLNKLGYKSQGITGKDGKLVQTFTRPKK